MISTEKVSLAFGDKPLFENVDVKFTPGNCYGLIGANGAGKSSFMKCLSGELETSSGRVVVDPNQRINVLRQDHFAFNDVEVLTTVIMGHARIHELMVEKDKARELLEQQEDLF